MTDTDLTHPPATPEDQRIYDAIADNNYYGKRAYRVVYQYSGGVGRCIVGLQEPIASRADIEAVARIIAEHCFDRKTPIAVLKFTLIEEAETEAPIPAAPTRVPGYDCRQAFEAYERERWDTSDFSRFDGVGDYKSSALQSAWEYWRDSRAQAPQLSEDELADLALTGGFVDCLTDLPSNANEAVRQIQDILVRYALATRNATLNKKVVCNG